MKNAQTSAILPIQAIIPETNIVAFVPHYDDFLFGLGGYALELKAQNRLFSKCFHILLIFSRSNYQNGSGAANFDSSLERIKFATGQRLLEDQDCLDELLGEHNYRYELLGERECFVRGKAMAESEMEFPHGVYADFTPTDRAIFERLQVLIRSWAMQADTALVFPLAIKEHIDHFITREAGLAVCRELGRNANARFYFQEDKPYAGIQTPDEQARIEQFVTENHLERRIYRHHPLEIVELAFKHYPTQVDEVYRKGVLQRPAQLQDLYGVDDPCDQLFVAEF